MILCPPGHNYLPYQVEGIQFAKDKCSVLIADEMGLGKTVQAIGWLNAHPEVETCLVVCPASLKINWAREMDKWLVSPCVDVTIVNYDVLHKMDMSVVYDVVVFDEAHYLKTHDAKRSRLARCIQARNKVLLSGTPILNKPIELWHLLHILDPQAWPLKSRMAYALRYCAAYQKRIGKKSVWDVSGSSNLGELRQLLAPIMIRRLKADVLKELPPKRRQILELPAAGDIKIRRMLKEWDERLDYHAKVKGMKDPVSVMWTEMASMRREVALAKLPMAIQIIENAVESSGQVVVFAHHHEVIDKLAEHLPSCVVVDGRTPLKDRQLAVDHFQHHHSKVFIGQIQAAGVGLTLTAASHVIFVELSWVPGEMSQAEDRCHRIGQTDSVLVQHLVLENSLDAKIAKALVRKQGVIERALDAQKEEEAHV